MKDENTENTTPEAPDAPEAPEADIPVEVAGETAETDRLAALEQEKKEIYERLLRTAADFDNFRKRSRKDVEDARHSAREQVLKEMLQVVDNLERALAATNQTAAGAEGIVEGVKLVLRQFQGALERFEVKAFESVGQPFDPTRHDAISQVETTEHPPGVVATEMVKGYTMAGRLLRPALVAVAKAPAEAAPEPAQEEGAE